MGKPPDGFLPSYLCLVASSKGALPTHTIMRWLLRKVWIPGSLGQPCCSHPYQPPSSLWSPVQPCPLHPALALILLRLPLHPAHPAALPVLSSNPLFPLPFWTPLSVKRLPRRKVAPCPSAPQLGRGSRGVWETLEGCELRCLCCGSRSVLSRGGGKKWAGRGWAVRHLNNGSAPSNPGRAMLLSDRPLPSLT